MISRNGDWFYTVGDQQDIVIQLTINAIKSAEYLSFGSPSHHHLWLREVGEIECMQRVSVFKHYIVRDIDNAIDSAYARCQQTLLHHRRAAVDLDASSRAPHNGDNRSDPRLRYQQQWWLSRHFLHFRFGRFTGLPQSAAMSRAIPIAEKTVGTIGCQIETERDVVET